MSVPGSYSASSGALTCADLTFTWPDGDGVFSGLNAAIGPARTGLIGNNGSGKSTLLRLFAGELAPDSGSARTTGSFGYLQQDLIVRDDTTVEQVLGIAEVRAAVRAIEDGDVRTENFAVVGDDWDVAERATAMLGRLGLDHLAFERRVDELSGGECVLLGLAARLLPDPTVLLLDEPTNNLDRAARGVLYDVIRSWRGVLLVVSHDRELLELVDQIAELHGGEIRVFCGNLSAYEEALAAEQQAAARMVRAAESDVRRQRRDLVETQVKQARARRYGQKMWDNKRQPKIIMAERKRQAQVSAANQRAVQNDRLAEARNHLTEAEDAVRSDDEIRVDLPDTAVPTRRGIITLTDVALPYGPPAGGPGVTLEVRGPERIALTGANGTGKTTLLRVIAGSVAPVSGEVRVDVPVRLLPQRLDLLDEALSVAQNVARFAPAAGTNAIRAKLARFLFRGAEADRTAAHLSGGERFRATLAALLLAEPAPQLLMLDEPTNNLDMASTSRLIEALRSYRGALLVTSHDVAFLREIGATRWVELTDGLAEIDPPY